MHIEIKADVIEIPDHVPLYKPRIIFTVNGVKKTFLYERFFSKREIAQEQLSEELSKFLCGVEGEFAYFLFKRHFGDDYEAHKSVDIAAE